MIDKTIDFKNCTNAWISGNVFEDLKKSFETRGLELHSFYNCFYRVNGVDDKLNYLNKLYQLQLTLKNDRRKMVIVSQKVEEPKVEEIAAIKLKQYSNYSELILDLSLIVKTIVPADLQKATSKALVDVLEAEIQFNNSSIDVFTNKAICLLCWLRRYQNELFFNWKMPEVSCFIYMGSCNNEEEVLFLKFLSRLPVDVIIFNPDLSMKCFWMDELLYEVNYSDSLEVNYFPQEALGVQMGTVAFHAEKELEDLLYRDSGLYKNKQYSKANSITLQTIFEEIQILWGQDLKYRPNFSTVDDVVNVPVIFAKVSGVKNGGISEYWASIRELIVEDTYVIKQAPFIKATSQNPLTVQWSVFFKEGKFLRTEIKNHPDYQYSFLRDEIQNHIFDKIELLIGQRIIKGTFENGMEDAILSTLLNINMELLDLIQKFDFTKKNPKLVYINTGEQEISLEDTILLVFLNLVGFDILLMIPTGYQSIENYLNKKIFIEHQIGGYIYDLGVPSLKKNTQNKHLRWYEKIFKRGI